MHTPPRKILAGAIGIVALLLLLAACATWVDRSREIDRVPDEQKIARSLGIIRTSTPADRKVLKVLFYGQSITRSGWDKLVIDHWKQKYPNTVFVTENRALGGFSSVSLLRTTQQDVTAFYPDLIIFHVYGDHHAYEQIIRLFRSLTAADIIVQTDHGEELPDTVCAEGLQITLHRAPGCAGWGWVHQRLWSDEMSYHKIPAIAKKYGLAVEQQRLWWRDYLLRTHRDPGSMLIDNVHPNAQGKQLMADFFDAYFDNLVEHWDGQMEDRVVSIQPEVRDAGEGQETIHFDGSRLELLTRKALASWPTVKIDGESPRDIDGCYLVTRTSPTSSVADWPAIRRISLRHDHTAEGWTAIVTNISPDQRSFEFKVVGSTSGEEGSGSSSQDFVSRSGSLRIEAQDWMLARAFEVKHLPAQAPLEVHWSVVDQCGGAPEVIDRADSETQYRYLLGAGLGSETHAASLTFAPQDVANILEFRAYKPPLGN